jgi:hypothetical protein
MAEKNVGDKKNSNVSKESLTRIEGEFREEKNRPKKKIRKVATMAKRLKKNTDETAADSKQEHPVEMITEETAGSGWSVQQQDTVVAHACARGMEVQEYCKLM